MNVGSLHYKRANRKTVGDDVLDVPLGREGAMALRAVKFAKGERALRAVKFAKGE